MQTLFTAFGHGHHGGTSFLWWLLFVLLLAALAVWAATAFRVAGRGAPALAADPALAELRLRYARGEVARDDFVRVSADLGAPPAEEKQ